MRYGLAIGLSLVLWGTAHVGLAADKDVERLEKSAEVITDIMGTPEKGIPHDLMNKSVCVAVIPSEKKLADRALAPAMAAVRWFAGRAATGPGAHLR